MKLQEYLDICYPKNGICKIVEPIKVYHYKKHWNYGLTRREITRLEIGDGLSMEWLRYLLFSEEPSISGLVKNTIKLEGHLDLSEFVNLRVLICSSRSNGISINSLDISKNTKLEHIQIYGNKITDDLNIFSHLTNLRILDLGTVPNEREKYNDFYGSLEALKDCKELEFICIGQQTSIKEGLEYVPLDKLTRFGCFGTFYQEILRPYDYDIKAWKLVNYPHLFDNIEELIERKTRDSQRTLEEVKQEQRQNDKSKRITRLESKIRLLETKNNELLNQVKRELLQQLETKK